MYPASQSGRSAPRAGFTLIELLVVVAIIAILASLLFPVLARAKKSAYRVQCINNLKQLAIGVSLYADEHDDFLPGPVWQGLFHDYDNQNTLFMPYYLATVLSQPAPSDTPQVLKQALCPGSVHTWKTSPFTDPQMTISQPISFILSITVTNMDNDLVTRPFGYPYSSIPSSASTNEPTKRLKQIRDPSNAMAIEDADQQDAVPLAAYYPFLPEKPIHGSIRNELFFDLHVEQVKATPQ